MVLIPTIRSGALFQRNEITQNHPAHIIQSFGNKQKDIFLNYNEIKARFFCLPESSMDGAIISFFVAHPNAKIEASIQCCVFYFFAY